jgi:hypothetical protein
MRETKATKTARYFRSLEKIGVSIEDADKLRLIERALHRWAELECGDGNEHGSWAIERDDETGKPYFVNHVYGHGQWPDRMTRTPTADREKGALKRLEKIMVRYPELTYYHQSDPRGCALWLVPREKLSDGEQLDSVYTRGVACCVD